MSLPAQKPTIASQSAVATGPDSEIASAARFPWPWGSGTDDSVEPVKEETPEDVNIMPPGVLAIHDGPLRDVYLLSRPLQALSSASRAARVAHWALKIGDYVHELNNFDGRCVYRNSLHTSDADWTLVEAKGQTKLNDQAITDASFVIINIDREYDLLNNSCQQFACSVLEKLTGKASVPYDHQTSLFPW